MQCEHSTTVSYFMNNLGIDQTQYGEVTLVNSDVSHN